jgi:predicted site-specific integrase-resolvase
MKRAEFDAERERWLDEIVSLTEAASLRKVSIDTLRSEIKKGRLHVIKLSERRRGMTRREAIRDARGL